MNEETITDFEEWIQDGNAIKKPNGFYVEQTTQYRKEFTLRELEAFFIKEYLH